MRVDRCGPRSLQATEVHTSHLKAATLHRMTAKGELRLWGLSDDGIFFFLLFRRRRGVQRKMDSDDSEPVGKNKHKIPPKKRKKQKRKAIELKLRKRRKENQEG